MAQQEPDMHNFSTSSSHRLPTISGTQALQHELRRARGIPTSLPTLDQLLASNAGAPKSVTSHVHVAGSTAGSNIPLNRGVRRGHVTEIYGPPGVGKTTFGMQLAVNAIKAFDQGVGVGEGEGEGEGRVLWISTGKPMVKERLVSIQTGLATQDASMTIGIKNGIGSKIQGEIPSSPPLPAPPPPTMESGELEEKLTYLHTTSLPHLLTMLIHPTALFPPPGTSLLIIDDLSNLLNSSFPRAWNRTTHTTTHTTTTTTTNTAMLQQRAKKSTARRFTVLDALSTALSKLAASRHLAVVLLNSATTSLRQGQRAVLKPALSGRDWDEGVDSRVVLLRDFWPEGDRDRDRATRREGGVYRVAILTRVGGRDVWREGVGFVIEDAGVRELRDADANANANAIAPERGRGLETVEMPRKQQQQQQQQHPADLEGQLIHAEAEAEADADADQQVDVDTGIDVGMGVQMATEIPSELALDLPLRPSSPIRPEEEVFQRASQGQRSQQNQQAQQNLQNQQNQDPNRKDDVEGLASHDIEHLAFHANQPGRNGERSENRKLKRKAREIADSEDEDEDEQEDEMLV